MSSQRTTVQHKLHRLHAWFDPESAAVVTILLGLFQLLLSVPLIHTDVTPPNLFILTVILGILIVVGGSLTMANEKNPSKHLLQGCASSNVVCLIGALLAFCLYCYSLSTVDSEEDLCIGLSRVCPMTIMASYSRSIIILLLLYNIGAIVLHCLLSFSAFRALKTD